ncbi:efflux RND transporter periplasmic adaptor subunit [Undibacterium sp. RTI2.1]|uniref:efflux RND transporter periplasmic adaptor subunit n=1 Tax=unclassified Undibacterium TaxID=2630295 RepID=UPI002AB43FA6|nr:MULTISPECIES: efflux RND transporter periplasmic adaptor subunit [unclassified Undibacterium]MDY7539466.1 efflux RND transporter periplasmic adaptor subunit [Undibacterium sp. 5I1]MEB0029616.1 efflux RND transporter periplasmic adaptor subunit [Undibacterium sp. RTI2.1]MEB0116087.1 efflux RND transporter periplasmic adaptor subunit [Undibacterium sp. RTI2.2]MEB0230725.1 efflux RND transporter periplasmic adaptor subunit [Undibacterium sp. 10I3]MEB0258796.1 efflux RND transporter periplasmic
MTFFTKKRFILAVVILLIAGAAASYYQKKQKASKDEEPQFKTAIVDKGNLTQTVTASGTLNPVALISVGSQVSGTVVELNADFNDRVKKGQVLLKLDPTIFNAQIKQSEATLASAESSKRLAVANLDRNQKLVSLSYISGASLDQLKREVEVADANIKLARAQLDRVQADFNNSVIRSPIDGVIIKRTIDMGQTVAASFQTPNLFQIARDLTKMQIDTNVSEADVGSLKDGQAARFVVDAYPDREFDASLRQFRLAANVQQNVVTYNVVLDVDNKDELLKPGMTAQVRLVVGNRQNVLRIPTAALRFKLSDEEIAKEAKLKKEAEKKAAESGAGSSAVTSAASASASVVPRPEAEDDVSFRSKGEMTRSFKIFVLDEKNKAKPVDIKIGLSNFRYTEVLSGDLKPGDKVIIRSLDIANAGSH